ncbi:MAG: VIT1/CCC1 transporter family protein [Candidatus Curtissbacteria bacterium]|nr:VIT1/CCC1 transporter family protein [Candidatus Curtissbacteria bacterium]
MSDEEKSVAKPIRGEFLREIVFGANDGVVTSIGFLVGIAGAVSDQTIVVIAGALTIIAGGASMALGNYLAVKSQREFYESKEEAHSENNPIISGVIIGAFYLLGGFPPLLPFILFRPATRALIMSIIVAIIVMGLIGFMRWTLNRRNLGGKIGETIIVGIIAAGIGFLAGEVLNYLGLSAAI